MVGFICFALAPQIALALGADGELEADCVRYSRILFLSSPAFVMQYLFQSFFIAAEKPALSLKSKCDRRTDQCGARLCVDRGISFGTGGSSTGYRSGTARRRNHPCNLFFQRERQLTAARGRRSGMEKSSGRL